MAKVDNPVTYTQYVTPDGKPTPWFFQFLQNLWEKTGGSGDTNVTSIQQTINQTIPQSGLSGQDVFQTEVSSNYVVTGDFDHEIITTTHSTGNVTITMPLHYEEAEVTVTRGGTGGVTIDGNGTNMNGLATQTLPMQYDSAHMYGKSTEWGLR